MKKLTILLFSILISFNSYGEWTKSTADSSGETTYINISSIKKQDGYSYWWTLADYPKPDSYGDMSSERYLQVDCALIRYKVLSWSFYKKNMGTGSFEIVPTSSIPTEWQYSRPNSVMADAIELGCSYTK